MKKLMIILFAGVLACVGCSVKKIEYERNEKGEISYRIYSNDHWLKTEGSGLRGGMTNDGQFEFSADGMKSSPSEEFNRTMATYTGAFVQLARLAAATYSPAAASIPLTTEAADPAAVAKLVDAQSAAKSAEITAKSQKQTALIKAQSDAKIAEQNAAAANAAECTDCTVK